MFFGFRAKQHISNKCWVDSSILEIMFLVGYIALSTPKNYVGLFVVKPSKRITLLLSTLSNVKK